MGMGGDGFGRYRRGWVRSADTEGGHRPLRTGCRHRTQEGMVDGTGGTHACAALSVPATAGCYALPRDGALPIGTHDGGMGHMTATGRRVGLDGMAGMEGAACAACERCASKCETRGREWARGATALTGTRVRV